MNKQNKMSFSIFQCFVLIFLIWDIKFEILLWGLIFRWTHPNWAARVLKVLISSTLFKALIQKMYYYYYFLKFKGLTKLQKWKQLFYSVQLFYSCSIQSEGEGPQMFPVSFGLDGYFFVCFNLAEFILGKWLHCV